MRLLPTPPPAAPVFAALDSALSRATEDRPLTSDVSAASDFLPALAAL